MDESKPVVLLIHGTGASTHSWRLLIPQLREYFRVFAIDLPGHGFTKTKTHNRSSLEKIAEDLKTLLGKEDINPKLIIGHSAGAALAFRLALDLETNQASIISINGVLGNYFDGLSGFFYPIAAKALATNPFSAVVIAKINQLTNQTRKIRELTGSKIDEKSLDYYSRLFSNSDHLYGTLAMMSQWSLNRLTTELIDFNQATLFLIGGNDKMVEPKALKKYTHLVKRSKIEVEEHLGHLMHEESPDKICNYIFSFYKEISS